MRTEYVGEVCLALDAGAQGVDQVADWLWNDPQAKIARCHGYIAHRATVRDVMAAARRELEAIRRPGRREEAMRMMHEYGGPHRLKTCRECEDTVEPGHALCERCEQEEERKMDARDWTAAHPIGTQVVLTEDDGTETRTVVRSEAWHLGHGAMVAKVAGKTGGWDVERIERADLTGISRLEILAAISKGVEAGVPVDLLVKGLLDAAVKAAGL